MSFQLVIDVFYILVLVANLCWSSELREFRWVKSQFDELLCGMSPPNKTLTAVGSRGECAIACSRQCPSPCQAVNYWNNAKLCQHFHYIPCSYAVQEDCINYMIMVSGFIVSNVTHFNSSPTCSPCTLALHHTLTVSFQAQNSPFPQIISTIVC